MNVFATSFTDSVDQGDTSLANVEHGLLCLFVKSSNFPVHFLLQFFLVFPWINTGKWQVISLFEYFGLCFFEVFFLHSVLHERDEKTEMEDPFIVCGVVCVCGGVFLLNPGSFLTRKAPRGGGWVTGLV